MPCSEARIAANQANALKSTGPKTAEGKARSRCNALKHGLTGEGVALAAEDAAESERLRVAFEAELRPSGEVGRALVRRMALMSVRMDRSVAHESATLADRVRRAGDEFDAEWPESDGPVDPAREAMRAEAEARAMFDPSKEATLARKYEAAAERGFFRALKELRQVERAARTTASPAPEAVAPRPALGSSLPAASTPPPLGPATAETPPRATPTAARPVDRPSNPPIRPVGAPPKAPVGAFNLPLSIGRAG